MVEAWWGSRDLSGLPSQRLRGRFSACVAPSPGKGTTEAEMTVPSAENPELSKGFPLKLAVGLNATLLASLSGRGSTCLVNAFPVHSA